MQELESLIEREQPIIKFLKNLTTSERKKLVPMLKKIHRKYFKEDQSSYSKSVNVKRELIKKAGFVCFNKREFLKFDDAVSLCIRKDYIKEMLPWYKPEWYSEIINEELPWGFDYEQIISLKNEGFLEPSDELIARSLTRIITETVWEKNVGRPQCKPSNLLRHKETLSEHIWKIFEVQTEIHWTANYEEHDFWIETFVNFSNEGKLDRKRVIKATLNTTNKGFDRNLSLWFGRLLLALKPTKNEVLRLQNDFFTALNSPFSSVVNSVLKSIKLIADAKEFESETFLENSSILLNSETKSVATSTLMIFDKIAKSNKKLSEKVCLTSAEALLHSDEKIQERTAKIITKYGDAKNENLTSEISMYADNLFFSSKEILKDFLIFSDEIQEDELFEFEEVRFLSEENKIETFETFDELLFFVSQSTDNNEAYHIDLLMNCLPKLNLLITKENVSKLEPILTRAFKDYVHRSWSTQKGYFEYLASIYLTDFGLFLFEKYPQELENYQQNKDKLSKEFRVFENLLDNLEKTKTRQQVYDIYKALFVQSKALFLENSDLEMLSTPTHKPCWIAPKKLIERISAYEKSGKTLDLLDFQIAIGRLPMNKNIPTSNEFQHIENEEIKSVLKYHFGFLEFEKCDIKTPQLWIQSVLSRNIELELYQFKTLTKLNLVNEKGVRKWECKTREYDYGYGRKEVYRELVFEDISSLKIDILSRIENLVFKKQKGIYSFFVLNMQTHGSIWPHDDIKCLYLLPNNPNPLLRQITVSAFRNSSSFDGEENRNLINVLKGLYEIWYRNDYDEATYLVVAIGLLWSDKTARNVSAELWIKANQQGTMNNKFLGELLGKLEHNEYGALKRFTDLIVSNMFNISKFHNEKLLILIDTMLGEMNEKPIRNTKKLVELFVELKRQFFDYQVSEKTLTVFEKWKSVKSLKSLVSF